MFAILLTIALFGGAFAGVIDECHVNSMFPYQAPNNCNNYRFCYEGVKLEFTCPSSHTFNPVTLQCDVPQEQGCLSADTSRLELPSCPLDSAVTFQPHIQSCNLYTGCADGKQYDYTCPEGMYFNEASVSCDLPQEAHCAFDEEEHIPEVKTGVPNPILCPPSMSSTFQPNKTDCTSYYNCVEGLLYNYHCPALLHFNEVEIGCDIPENAGCKDSITCPPGTPVKPLPHPEDCSKFYFCLNGTHLDYDCCEGFLFNPETMLCDIPEEEGCPGKEMCEVDDNYVQYPHEDECDKYYICFDGKPLLICCPAGLHYNPLTGRCEAPDEEICGFTTLPPPTTTTTIITTTTPAPMCSGEEDGTVHEHETECDSYYTCVGELPYKTCCPQGVWLFNPATGLCDWPKNVVCSSKSCYDFEKYPHEENCNSYYQCMDGQFLIGYCPDPLQFNVRLGRCDKGEMAGCTTKLTGRMTEVIQSPEDL